MAFDFKTQLEVGSRGEELFLERYPTKLIVHPHHAYDFDCERTGRKIELKTDTYNIHKTSNFFMERYSDVHKKSPGGVWQSIEKGVDTFCYYFVRHNVWFQFDDLPLLIDRLNDLTKKQGLVYIKNKGWVTAGYKIARDDLADLFDVWSWDSEEEDKI